MLSHIVRAGSKRPNPGYIKTLMDFPIPENLTQFKRLPGVFAYKAKWVSDYSKKIAPLLEAQKQLAFPLKQASRLAIKTLKKDVASAVIRLPRANEPLVLQNDASGTGNEVALSQGDKLVGFCSRNLKPSEMAYSVVERNKLRTTRVSVCTDQRALSFIFGSSRSYSRTN